MTIPAQHPKHYTVTPAQHFNTRDVVFHLHSNELTYSDFRAICAVVLTQLLSCQMKYCVNETMCHL